MWRSFVPDMLADLPRRPAAGEWRSIRPTLQHGLKIAAGSRLCCRHFRRGARSVQEGHLCCGSAGTYSLLQPALSGELRQHKCRHCRRQPATVLSANIGCINLQAGTAGNGAPLDRMGGRKADASRTLSCPVCRK